MFNSNRKQTLRESANLCDRRAFFGALGVGVALGALTLLSAAGCAGDAQKKHGSKTVDDVLLGDKPSW